MVTNLCLQAAYDNLRECHTRFQKRENNFKLCTHFTYTLDDIKIYSVEQDKQNQILATATYGFGTR